MLPVRSMRWTPEGGRILCACGLQMRPESFRVFKGVWGIFCVFWADATAVVSVSGRWTAYVTHSVPVSLASCRSLML